MTTILIVEDLPALREHAAKVVRETLGQDVQIVEAGSGTQGLEMARKHDPDFILLDINMPDMSGVKVAEQIWKDKPTKKILFWSQFHKESYVRAIAKILPDEAIHGYALKGEVSQNLAYAIASVYTHDNSYIDPVVRGVQAKLQSKDGAFNDVEYETLIDIAIGLTDRAIAKRRHISVRGVQKRISALLEKLLHGENEYLKESAGMEVLNPRTRLLCVAFKRGLLNAEELDEPEKKMFDWLDKEFFKNADDF